MPALLENGCGSIVNIGSIAGIRYLGVPCVAYAATKAGALGLTRARPSSTHPEGFAATPYCPD